MKATITQILILCVLLFPYSCRKPYNPPATSTSYSYLVVEGVINSGADSTIINLSRTIKLDSNTRKPEAGAKVTVESDKNDKFTLTETVAGTYAVTNLNLPTDRHYRLHIFTANNKEYVSDYVENKITPSIDSISYKLLAAGVQFYVNTHDPQSKTRYYRWEYNEAWTYYSEYYSVLIYNDGNVIGRPLDSNVNYCYKFAVPDNNIFVSSTDKLAKDEIYQYPLGYTSGLSGKLQRQYGLTVKQYALTTEAYKYWQLLKTNTEQLGSIFDAQPSTAFTNLHAVTNPGEPVIGYVSVSTIALKRLFLTNRDFPFSVTPPPPIDYSCTDATILFVPTSSFNYRLKQSLASGDSLLWALDIDTQTNKVIGYRYAKSICVDCRLKGGTIHKPSYWPF